ncbi:MAG: hypothetical protein DRN66_01520 [Candidatus Nanohalarchaeota archaeon]|nr:MAG: hypothetical protein DRN66_01520 [Candidatus Nanohaloarchaeota archaeon]
MIYLKEKVIASVFFALSLFFLNNANIGRDTILYALAMNYAGISVGNVLLFALFFSLFIAIIASSSILREDKKNSVFTAGIVFIGLFALIGLKIPVLYGLLFSFLTGCCFYWFMNNISKEVDEFKRVNYMRAFMIIKSNTHKYFFLISFFFAVLVALLAVDISGMEVFGKTRFDMENASVELDNVVDMAMEMQKQNAFRTADMASLWIMQSIHNDTLLNREEKIACIDSINRSSVFVREKINQSYSGLNIGALNLDLENMSELRPQNGQNQIFEQADFLINIFKEYYFLIAGFVIFFIFSFCGSIIALFSSLMAVMLLKGTHSLDKKQESNTS